MSDLSGYTLRLVGTTDLVTETCYSCGVLFALSEDFRRHRLRDGRNFYCPNGHQQHYIGKTPEQQLKEAEAREVALKDQLQAAVHEAEQARQALLRDRQRFANGVCPCCNRSFENVRRHMATQHPDYDPTKLTKAVEFKCSCGRTFESFRGLRTHQGHQRPDDWASRGLKKDYWNQRMAHLTVAGASR